MSRAPVIMTARSLSLAVICVLSIWNLEYTAGCVDGQDEVDGQCCDLCSPGTYLKDYCTKHQQTVCSPCEEGYFSDRRNMFDRCEECRSCQQEYTLKCTPTTNANCSCRSGFLCSNNVCSECEEHTCITGEKLKRTARALGDGLIKYSYQCERLCPHYTYFDEKEEICKMHTDGIDSMKLIFGIGFVLSSLILLVFLSCVCTKMLRKHTTYNTPTEILAVSTNASDFHLSKEESGYNLIMQDESKNSTSFALLQLEKVST
ncbi:tumor necrosis factor receptor superfamily member 5-like [Etheostoma cragini]|uniref:tumor necrosis factor receptor superfamily member 5-like n=1 Tax=Etheostoma cragini TaxID=417921 RepID=UPI00155EA6A9|nr:tumor necrosis factor receptor superfamily member 5-like [Etheostoma cragini]